MCQVTCPSKVLKCPRKTFRSSHRHRCRFHAWLSEYSLSRLGRAEKGIFPTAHNISCLEFTLSIYSQLYSYHNELLLVWPCCNEHIGQGKQSHLITFLMSKLMFVHNTIPGSKSHVLFSSMDTQHLN